MKINIDWKKVRMWTLISLPFVIGAVIVIKQINKSKALNAGSKQKLPDPSKVVKGTTKSDSGVVYKNTFPLKKGVKDNQYVGMLQSALGVGIDNWFLDETRGALVEQTGLDQIDSLEQLNDVIAQINNQNNMESAVAQRQSVADALLNKYNDLKYQIIGINGNTSAISNIVFLNTTVAKELHWDFPSGSYKIGDDASFINYRQGDTIPLNDVVISVDNGYIVINRSTGVNTGIWRVLPQSIDLV